LEGHGMTISANEKHIKGATETLNVALSLSDMLSSGETLTGTPTVTCTGLTLASKTVNSSALTDNDGNTIAIGHAVQFSVAGGTAGTRYEIDVTVSTTSSPAQTINRLCILDVK
jgi:hypothetical protein